MPSAPAASSGKFRRLARQRFSPSPTLSSDALSRRVESGNQCSPVLFDSSSRWKEKNGTVQKQCKRARKPFTGFLPEMRRKRERVVPGVDDVAGVPVAGGHVLPDRPVREGEAERARRACVALRCPILSTPLSLSLYFLLHFGVRRSGPPRLRSTVPTRLRCQMDRC